MRELTEYEKQKWYDGSDSSYEFSIYDGGDIFLCYGDEFGEAFDSALSCVHKEDYGLSGEFVRMAQIEVLNMYYYQFLHFYVEAHDEPTDFGLPSKELVVARAKELDISDVQVAWDSALFTDDVRRLWDWAMEWREEHLEETSRARRLEELKREQERLEKE